MSSAAPTGCHVLVVDDDADIREMVADALRSRGYRLSFAENGAEAIELLGRGDFDCLLLDLHMPKVDGWAVLDHLRSMPSHPITLVMSAFADIPRATEAMRRGAVDFVEKPFSIVDLFFRLDRALEGARSTLRLASGAVVVSDGMRSVFALAERVAAAPRASALIVGESGVGKELVAARIHDASDRRNGPFMKVNLAAIPEGMIEAELFGAVRGAYTDAKKERVGLLASANGGTLLLDEITEFRVDLQPKLLRVLEERRYFRLGSDEERTVDVRVLAATNRDPLEAIADGSLRQDLYYRLSTVLIEVPPLRVRPDAIVPLARHFVEWFAAQMNKRVPQLTDDAVQALERYPFPGNVRELRNLMERAVIMVDGDRLSASSLSLPAVPASVAAPLPSPAGDEPSPKTAPRAVISIHPSKLPLKLEFARQQTIEIVERRQIRRALDLAGGNRSSAAVMLGISRTTLWEKMKQYGIE
jgi:two-component system response regulator AtoC